MPQPDAASAATRLSASAWAGAIGASIATVVGLLPQAGAILRQSGGLRAAFAALSISATLGVLFGAAAAIPLLWVRGPALAFAGSAIPTLGAALALWQRPAFGSAGMKALLVAASVLVPLFVALLVSQAGSQQRRQSFALGALGVFGAAIALCGVHPLARLHTAVRISCVALSALVFGVAAARLLKPRGWAARPLVAIGSLSALLAASLIALGNPSARLALSEHASIGREALAVLSPLGLWQSGAPSGAELPSAPAAADVRLPSAAGVPIVLITIDALRADCLRAYGGPAGLTPNLNRFFDSAVVFDRAYAPFPSTMVSVPSLLTGRIAWGPVQRWRQLTQQRPALGTLLAPAGYTRAVYVSPQLHVSASDDEMLVVSPPELGFNQGGASRAPAPDRAQALRAALEPQAGKKAAFVWAHFAEPHAPYDPHPGFDRGSSERQRYEAEVAFVDHALGPVLAELAKMDAIVWITADHGEAFGEHGQSFHASSLYDEQVRVPLGLRAPGLTPRRVPGAASLLDVVPTTLALVGLPVPASLDGQDLRARALGQGAPGRAFALFENRMMLASGEHKLLCDVVADACALYDLAGDPRELSNLAGKAPELERGLAAELIRFIAPEAPAKSSIRTAVALRETRELTLRAPDRASSLLSSGAPEQRKAAARAFALTPSLPPETLAALLRASGEDRDPEVRAWSAIALANASHPSADRAIEALPAIEGPAELADWLAVLRYRRALDGAERAVAVLGRSRDTALGAALIDAVAARRDRAQARVLSTLLSNPELAERAARVLVELDPALAARQIPPAIDQSRANEVRQMLVRQLGGLRGIAPADREPVIALLRRSLVDSSGLLLKAEASLALERLGQELPAWLGAASSAGPPTRRRRSSLSLAAPESGDYLLCVALPRPGPAEALLFAHFNGASLGDLEVAGIRMLTWTVPADHIRKGENTLELSSTKDLAILGVALVPVSGGPAARP